MHLRAGRAFRVAVVVSFASIAGMAATARGATVMSPAPAPDHRMLTPAGTLLATQGQFPAGAVLDAAGSQVFVADANKTADYVESFSATLPTVSGAATPASAPGAQNPTSQSGQITTGPDGRVYAAGGTTGTVRAFTDTNPPLPSAIYQVGVANPLAGPSDHSGYIAAVAVPDATHLIATEPFDRGGGKGDVVVRYDTATGHEQSATVGTHPTAIALDRAAGAGAAVVAVANQGDGTVSVLDATTLATRATIATGREPAALAFSADGSRLFVVDSLDDELTVVDAATWTVRQRVSLSGPDGIGAEPNAVALSGDGRTAYVTLGADNAVAVASAGADGRWAVAGRIPTARYPTGVAVDQTRSQLFVTIGKAGSQTTADMPTNPGGLEQIPVPDGAALAAYSAQVAADDRVAPPVCSAAPYAGIEHVLYVIRENKTYDAELGDEPGGNPAYLTYGRSTTPNTHALAERFALLQNFTTDQEVSDTGHQVLLGGVANDWVERFSEQAYNLGGAQRPGAELGNDDGILWAPANYLLDSALSAGISFRDYGEFYRRDQKTDAAVSPQLDAHVVHDYPGFGFDPSTPDTTRVAFWRKQFAQDVAAGTLPRLEVIYLPEDHTTSGVPGTPSAQAQVASNDLATGQIVDTLSHSPYWASSAVFVAEDDPQDGMDHVDPHRSVGLVIGPHVRAGVQTAAPYDHLSMLRTIEQILGLDALTEHDATARPLASLFNPGAADATPYSAITPTPGTPATAPPPGAAAVPAASGDCPPVVAAPPGLGPAAAAGATPPAGVAASPFARPGSASRRLALLRVHVRHGGHRTLIVNVRDAPGVSVELRFRRRSHYVRTIVAPTPDSGTFRVIVRRLPLGSLGVVVTVASEPAVVRSARLSR